MSPFATIRRLRRGPFTPGLAAALAAGVILHIAGIALIGATWRMPAPPADPEVFVSAEREDSALNEQAGLLDPSPLFLPTKLNYGAGFAQLKFADSDAPPLPAPVQHLPDKAGTPFRFKPRNVLLTEACAKRPLEDRLPRGSEDTFFAFGRVPPVTGALKPAGARCVLKDEATGAIVAELPLTLSGSGAMADALPAPAEFFVEIDAYGASPPILRSIPKNPGEEECYRQLSGAVAAALADRPQKPGRFTVIAVP